MARAPQRIIPMLVYADAPAAITFLCNAFGFEESLRFDMPDGRIGHAELVYAGNTVMLSSEYPEMELSSPQHLKVRHCQVYCDVDDVDAHFLYAKNAGATILAEPEDQPHGSRIYRALDIEGHRWLFSSLRKAEAVAGAAESAA